MKHQISQPNRKVHVFGACCVGALLVGATACFFLGALPAPAQDAQTNGRSLRIAVVDIERVFSNCAEGHDYEESRRLTLDKMNRTIRRLERQLRLLRSEYENLAPGTEAAAQKGKETQEAIKHYQQTKQRFESDMAAEHNRFLRQMFAKIGEAAEQYATNNGVDLVLRKHNLKTFLSEPSQANVFVATVNVLYSHKRFDVTDRIIALLNATYAAEIEVK